MASPSGERSLQFPTLGESERPSLNSSLQVSEESFATACTSFSSSLSTSSTIDVRSVAEPPPTASIRALRKSTSIDSFVRHRAGGRDDGRRRSRMRIEGADSQSSRSPESAPALSAAPSSMSLSNYFRSKVGQRRRGASSTDNDTSTHEDSDFDKAFFSSKGRRIRARLLSFKSSKTTSASDREASAQPPMFSAKSSSPAQPSTPSGGSRNVGKP